MNNLDLYDKTLAVFFFGVITFLFFITVISAVWADAYIKVNTKQCIEEKK
jgi:hypothetical protein